MEEMPRPGASMVSEPITPPTSPCPPTTQSPSTANSIPSPLPSLEAGGGAENSKLLNTAALSGDHASSRSHPESPQWDERCFQCSCPLGIHKGFRSSGPHTKVKDQILEQ